MTDSSGLRSARVSRRRCTVNDQWRMGSGRLCTACIVVCAGEVNLSEGILEQAILEQANHGRELLTSVETNWRSNWRGFHPSSDAQFTPWSDRSQMVHVKSKYSQLEDRMD